MFSLWSQLANFFNELFRCLFSDSKNFIEKNLIDNELLAPKSGQVWINFKYCKIWFVFRGLIFQKLQKIQSVRIYIFKTLIYTKNIYACLFGVSTYTIEKAYKFPFIEKNRKFKFEGKLKSEANIINLWFILKIPASKF